MTRNEILAIRSLQNSSERKRSSRFVVEGVKGLIELGESRMEVMRIYCVERMLKHIPSSLEALVEIIVTKSMVRICSLMTPPGLLAIVSMPRMDASTIIQSVNNRSENGMLPFVLIADGISDPGNLGTLIRTADWFGLSGLLTTPGSADVWSPKCVQATMGSIFRVPVSTIQNEDLDSLQSQNHYALDLQGSVYTEVKWKPGLVWVGSESHGISFKNDSIPFEAVHIPRTGEAESLNAGIAGSIVCAEISRVWGLKP
jgi:TrmH family RNA methyltransferase